MAKLTDSQLVILSAAAQRDDHAIYPTPKSIKLNKAALATVLKSLLKQQFITERPATVGEETWRDGSNGKITLIVTDAGLAAIDTPPKPRATAKSPKPASKPATPTHSTSSKPAKAPQKQTPAAVKAGTKLARLIDLLSRKTGATLPEAMALTGWQAHSVRGAISGALKKKLGLTIAAEANAARGRVYRIVAQA
jgi:hypothetical protein